MVLHRPSEPAAVTGQVKTTDFPEIEEKQLRIQLRSFCVAGSGMMGNDGL
jgi:hypothetical protein